MTTPVSLRSSVARTPVPHVAAHTLPLRCTVEVAERQRPDWYPALSVPHLPALERLRFEPGHDDLGPLEAAYAELGTTPFLVFRYTAVADRGWTVWIDPVSALHRFGSPQHFADEVLAALGIDATHVVWRNTELDTLFGWE